MKRLRSEKNFKFNTEQQEKPVQRNILLYSVYKVPKITRCYKNFKRLFPDQKLTSNQHIKDAKGGHKYEEECKQKEIWGDSEVKNWNSLKGTIR